MRSWTFPEARPAGAGPWVDEPDKVQWVDQATGLDCLIVRNYSGALCGYVGVPPEHPWHGLDYDHASVDASVHGGLTFAERCQAGAEDGWRICHVPEPDRPADVWWFGFDCAHVGDLIPSIDIRGLTDRGEYRTIAYVQAEVTSLARQLAEVAL